MDYSKEWERLVANFDPSLSKEARIVLDIVFGISVGLFNGNELVPYEELVLRAQEKELIQPLLRALSVSETEEALWELEQKHYIKMVRDAFVSIVDRDSNGKFIHFSGARKPTENWYASSIASSLSLESVSFGGSSVHRYYQYGLLLIGSSRYLLRELVELDIEQSKEFYGLV